MIRTLCLVAAGGALGAIARFLVSAGVYQWLGTFFPWGTLTVNVAGSFAIGLLFSHLSDVAWFHSIARPFLVVGFLGAFTTFSAFSLDTVEMIEDGRALLALTYAVGSVVLCCLAAYLGAWSLAKQ